MSAAEHKHVFISHATADDGVVAAIRQQMGALGHLTWVDSREMSGGNDLEARIFRAIEEATHFVVALSPKTINSAWVPKEVAHARHVKEQRGDNFKLIPVLLPGVEPTALGLWFGPAQVLAVRVADGPGGVEAAMPALLDALGERLPTDPAGPATTPAPPVADLVLELTDPALSQEGDIRRAVANATLTFCPAEPGAPEVRSRRYRLTAPLGPIETGELAWYLERFCHWPSGVFLQRAKQVEEQLPEWGRRLYACLISDAARDPFAAWNAVDRSVTRRFTVLVDASLVAGDEGGDAAAQQAQAAANEAATRLLSLPWELLHDQTGYLFQGARAVRVRRQLPNRTTQGALQTEPPIRVLLVSPRPEDERAGYIDHRVSARPLVEALGSLGALAELTLLTPPTFPALGDELERARAAGTPYHVVHFDGHGVYDPAHGLGALVFEEPADAHKPADRRSALVDAQQIAGTIRDHRVPLFFLEACQSAMSDTTPTASVAGQLLQNGVASVAAMSHTVLVETARRFVSAFYKELMQGASVGQAMFAGRRDLFGDAFRGKVFSGELRLQDWFVPVLFQEEQDPQLVRGVPAEHVQAVVRQERALRLGDLPPAPEHTFVGRSRELLVAERLLARERYVVVVGEGGEGKTTLAAELARWLAQTRRFARAVFVPFDKTGDARTALWEIGRQLVPGFLSEAGQDPKEARLLVERALTDEPVVIVLDNLESVLPPPPGSPAAASFEPDVLTGIFDLCAGLGAIGQTRLVFTSREALSADSPFGRNHVRLGRLDRGDAIALVGRVLGENNLLPHTSDAGQSEEEIEKLVEAVGCHARSLVLLAREVAHSGVRDATAHLNELMAALHAKHPDDRERSLLASVELSLRRLPDETRQKIRPLGVFQGGGNIMSIAMVLGLDTDKDEEVALAHQLIDAGLAELLPHNYLRFDPALAPALLSTMSEPEREAARTAWAEAMEPLAALLCQQRDSDPHLALGLAQWELPNLLAALEHLARTAQAERVIEYATNIEGLAQPLGRTKAVARAATIRAEAARPLEWGHSSYLNEQANVERLYDVGHFAEAVASAERLLQRCEAAGEQAYPEAAYDIAVAYLTLGRALQMGRNAEAALALLAEAQSRFETLVRAGGGNAAAARMAAVASTETADCLTDLGRLDEAAALYEAAVGLAERRNDPRSAAVNRGQLGTVRWLQRRYADAIAAHAGARNTFEKMGEFGMVAIAWHQIGIVYKDAGDYPSAERAYQESLRINVQTRNRSGEASTLVELGNLYSAMNRKEDAVRFYREAAATYVELNDSASEGVACNNAAASLIRLGRFDEARRELVRSIECEKPLGHAAEPWKTFLILHNLERAVGNAAAAAAARAQAAQAYLAYRRAGGEILSGGKKIFALVAQAVAQGQTNEAASALAAVLGKPDTSDYHKALGPALQRVLAGSRDPALAADPNLDYDDAAELMLLLERLGDAPPAPKIQGTPEQPDDTPKRARRWPWQRGQ